MIIGQACCWAPPTSGSPTSRGELTFSCVPMFRISMGWRLFSCVNFSFVYDLLSAPLSLSHVWFIDFLSIRLFILPLINSYILSFIYSSIGSFVFPFIHSIFRSFTHKFIDSFISSEIHWFIHLLLIHSYIHSKIYSYIYSYIYAYCVSKK